MAVSLKIAAFWDIAICSLVEVYRRFRGAYCLCHQSDAPLKRRYTSTRLHSAISQKAVILLENVYYIESYEIDLSELRCGLL
jgi:hypothetical protein